MKILGIETSCDETSSALVEDGTKILSNIISTSSSIHALTGGIIPETAAREQIKFIIPVIQESLKNESFDAIAVTYGPGLIGSLLVGIETAKALAFAWGKPIIPTNHLLGHIYANFLDNPTPPTFPNITLVVSGGHTDLIYFKNHGDYLWLGGTRDDAAGEAFDKTARLLGLPYPGGPQIAKLAERGDPSIIKLPRPMIAEKNYDFSFSGLKTAVLNYVLETRGDRERGATSATRSAARMQDGTVSWQDQKQVANLCASIQEAVVDVLVTKTIRAAKEYSVKEILLSGGVAANKALKEKMRESFDGRVQVPPPNLCTDNGAMIASAAFFKEFAQKEHLPPFQSEQKEKGSDLWKTLQPNPTLHF